MVEQDMQVWVDLKAAHIREHLAAVPAGEGPRSRLHVLLPSLAHHQALLPTLTQAECMKIVFEVAP